MNPNQKLLIRNYSSNRSNKACKAIKSFIFLFFLLVGVNSIAQPIISSFSPVSGPSGTTVTITGTGFSTTALDNIVYFGGVRANVSAATATTLSVTVPPGAGQLPMSVTVNRLTGYSSRIFSVTFQGAGNLGIGSFDSKIDSPAVLDQRGLAIADYDGDGKPDLATVSITNVPASYIAIHRNTSINRSISFASPLKITIGAFGVGIAAADFDGDGKLDIAASYIDNNGNVSIFKNNSSPGALMFDAAITYAAGKSPYTVLARDIDLDGKPDLIISNFTDNSFSVLRNTSSAGTISFAPKLVIPTAAGPYSIAAGDLDNDGKTDIAVTNQLSNSISVFQNRSTSGNIQFGTPINIATPANPADLTIGDADGDGKPEIVFVNLSIRNVFLLPNISTAGAISFGTRITYPVSGYSGTTQSVSMNDINGDAKPDLLVSGPDSYVAVLENLSVIGSINFALRLNCFSISPFRATAADFDLDDKADIAVANTGNRFAVFRNRSNEPFIANFTPASAVKGDMITITGNNLSTVNDIKFGGTAAASIILVNNTTVKAVVADGAGGDITVTNIYGTVSAPGFTFNSPPRIQSFNPVFSGTGDTITITGTYFGGASAVSFGGVAATWFKINSPTSISAVVGNGASGQIIITNPYGNDTIGGYIYYPPPVISGFTPTLGNKGTIIDITGNNFNGTTAISVGGEPVSSFAVNSNGSITATAGEGAFGAIKLVTPGGTAVSTGLFSSPAPSITAITPAIGLPGSIVTISGTNFRDDPSKNIVFFGAAKATVVSASNNSLSVVVPEGTTYKPITVTVNNYTAQANYPFNSRFTDFSETFSDSSFSWKRALPTNDDPHGLQLVDLDGDGKTEILSSNYSTGTVSVLKNKSSIAEFNFNGSVPVTSGDGYSSIKYVSVADLNNDGKPDIIISYGGNYVDVVKNTSVAGSISFAPKQTFTNQGDSRGVIAFDFDGDGRTDIATVHAHGLTSTSELSILMNNGANGIISFAPKQVIPLPGFVFHLEAGDFDGDKKIDLVVALQNFGISVFRNTGTAGTISFDAPIKIPASITPNINSLIVADIDEDGKQDIATLTDSGFKVIRNTTVGSTLSFMQALAVTTGGPLRGIIAGQLDGDGKVDLLVVKSGGFFLVKNTSTGGNFSFDPAIPFTTRVTYNWISAAAIGDLDGDGKTDIAALNDTDNKISLFRNQSGERNILTCSNTNFTIAANSTGTLYQWQVNDGNGFLDIANGLHYEGTNTGSLQIKNIPVEWNLNQYRCVVNGAEGRITNITLNMPVALIGRVNTWTTACINTDQNVEFASSVVPSGSTVQLWESINGAPFTFKAAKTFFDYSTPFTVHFTTAGIVKYYFRMMHPAGTLCAVAANTDTMAITITDPGEPVISSNGLSMTLTNPVAGTGYNWQVLKSGNWADIPGETGNTYYGLVANKYRVRAWKAQCIKYSNELQMALTAIDPVTGLSMGIHTYPNPSTTVFVIDSLKLNDNWLTLEVSGADGRKAIAPLTIVNRTRVLLNIEALRPGLYFAILRRKNGAAAVVRFVKL